MTKGFAVAYGIISFAVVFIVKYLPGVLQVWDRRVGATTFSITSLSITTFSIMTFIITINK
jgi:hypothetical protein